jgi:gliding motility-associated-like protein
MITFKKAISSAFITAGLAFNLSTYAQCPVTASANALTINCGEGVNLSATGTPGFYIFENDFNTGTVGPGWQATSTAMYTNPCGPGPGGATDPHMWMGSSAAAPRNATTNAYDLSTGGTICFDMRYAIQGACGLVATCDCEGPDLPDEGVHLQYSIDGGATWIDIQYWDPMGGTDPTMTTWNYYCVTIPAGAMTTSTMIRWAQLTSSNAGSDHWGLDNITIATNDPNFMYDWTHDGLPAATTSATPTVFPTTNTTYTVVYANSAGTQSCTASVTINVVAPTVTATASPVTICQGATSQLTANSSLIATPPSSCGINTYAGCPANSQAGEPQIGTGTTIASYNSGANYVFGDFGSTGGVRTQIIYRASELIAAGFSAGQITNMQLDIGAVQTNGGTAPSVTHNGFTIQLGCTSTSAFANSSAWMSGLTTVFPATTVTIVPGWNTFTFPNSYNWDGTSNIVVQLCWYNGSGGGSTCAKTRTHAAGFNAMLASYVNASGAALNCATHTSFQTVHTIRPNTKFGTCEPRAITLNYNWSPSSSLSNSTIYNPVAAPAATTTYTVSVSENGAPAACAATSTVTVTVVTSSMTGVSASRCGTGTVNLSTSGCTGTVNWYANASGGSPIATGSTFTTPSISSTTTYYATCTQSGCESPRVPVIATVNPVPSSTFTISPATVCAGVNTTITYTGAVIAGQNYTWDFAGGTVVSGSGVGPYTVNWPNPVGGSYNVTLSVASPAGCSSVLTTQTATVSPGPGLTITPPAPSYCAPGSVNLTGNVVFNTPSYTTTGANPADFTVPDNGVTAAWNGSTGTFTTSPINITGLNPSSWNITSVCLNINADKDQEVIVYLRNPCGGLIRLIRNNGGTASTGFNTTCFSPTAVTAISAGTAPFNGTFIPEQGAAAWTAFLSCGAPNGSWDLLVGDAATSSPVAGLLTAVTLTNWTINFTSSNYITTYLWSPSTNLTSTNTASTTASPSTTTTYSLTVTDAVGCPATTPVTVTVTNPQVATFSYTGTPYCQNAANPSPTFSGGGVAGTFSSTAGLSINASTGAVNLAASTTGTYTVTNTIAASGGCPAVSATSSITITPAPVAAFSYTGTPYCQNAANPSPTFSGGGVAGIFSSTAGLSINTSTGAVNLATSTAGTYTVTNTIAASGGCSAVTATSSITITPAQVATFGYTASPYCQNASNPSPAFSGGGVAGTFSSTAGLSINASTGTVNLATSTAGTYTVTNTIAASGGCPAVTATSSITITTVPVATFSYTGTPYCQNAANPSPTFSGGGIAGTFSSTAGLVFVSTATGQVNLSASTPGTYTVTNTIAPSSGCPAATATASITITPLRVAAFSYTASPYCQNGINPSPTFSGGGIAGTFSSTAGLVFVSTATGQINLSASTAGTYTVTNTIAASGGCPAVTATANITITPLQVAAFSYTASPYCQNATNPSPTYSGGGIAGTFSSTAGLVFVSTSTGQVNLSASAAGTYTVTNTIAASGGCPAVTATASITITPVQAAAFSYTASPYCQNAGNPSPTFSGGGVAGTFSSTAGLVFVSTGTGQINLSASTAGTYTVTNTIAASGGCPAVTATSSITITPAQVATFSYAASPYCQNASNPSPVFSGGGVAGTFSSTAGLSINAGTGVVNLVASTAGTYTVTNTIAASGGCAAVTATSSITISPVQNAAFNYSTGTFCQTGTNPTPTITGTAGGTFTSSPAGLIVNAGTGQIDLAGSALNTYTVTYTTAGPCANTSSVNVTITTAPAATFSYTGSPYCQNGTNPTPTFSSGGTAGTFSSTAGLVFVNTGTGEIDIAASTPGTYTVTNTIAAAGGCSAASASANITISSSPVAAFSYTASPYCQNAANPSPTFSGGGTAGTFSSTAGLSINASTGLVNLMASTPGTYTVTNTIAASGACPAITATADITITPLPVASFSYTASPYCQNAADPSPTLSGGGVAGTFSSTAGLIINASTGMINLAASTAGTYTVTNTIAAANGCPAVTANATVTITSVPTATFSYTASPYCQNAANPSPVFSGGGTAGTFSSIAGLVFVNTATGQIDLAASTPGSYTVTNTIAASGGCPAVIATANISITPLPVGTFSYTASPYCQNAADPSPVFSSGGVAGTFSSTAGLVFISSGSGQINLAASTPGTYTVTNTIASSGGCPAVIETAGVTITPVPVATFSYIASPYCQSAANPSPVFSGGGTAGTFSSTAGLVFVSTATGQVNLSASTPGTYTVTNTITGSGGCPSVSATAGITINAAPTATFNYTASPYCQNAANPSPTFSGGGVAGTFTSTAGLIFVNSSTGQVDLATSTAGTYTVTNTIPSSGGCPSVTSTASITITPVQNAGFNYSSSTFCQTGSNPSPVITGTAGGTFTSSPAGLIFVNASTGEIDLAASGLNTYTITYTTSGPCGSTSNATVTITDAPVATFSYPGTPYCQDATDPSPTFSGGGSAGTFSSTAGLSINASNGIVNLAASIAGTYTVTNTITSTGGCAAATATSSITINPVQNSGFNYSSPTFCQTGTNPTPVITGAAGGTFTSSPAGLNFVSASTGEIDLAGSALNTYTITYTTPGPCPNSSTASVTISNPTSATMNYNGPYCQNAVNPSPNFAPGSSAGTFTSAPAGLTFTSTGTGQVDLMASTPGTYTITNTIAGSGGCPASVDTAAITITAPAVATFSYTGSPYCQNAGTNPTPTFIGGGIAGTFTPSSPSLVFVNTSTGEIDLAASTPGTYTVANTIPASGGCAAITATANITIAPLQNASFNYSTSTFCQSGSNPVPVITGVTGGTFTASPAGLVFANTSTGEINLTASGLNTYTITYTTAGPCANLSTAMITITNAPVATFSYTGTPYCQNASDPTPTFSGGGTGGTFSSTGGLVFVNTSTGEVDLSASTPGIYTVTNNIPASGGCAAASATANITISPLDNAGFSYSAASFCQSGINPSPTITGVAGGTFTSSPAGLSFVSAGTGEINLAASTINTYTITYTTPGPCTNTGTTTITIDPAENAAFSYSGSTFCSSGSNPSPTITGTAGGTFTASPAGLAFLSTATGEINLAGSTLNTYTITYTTPGPCTATSTATVTITNAPSAAFSYTASPYCIGGTNPSPSFTGSGSAGTFSSTAGLNISASSGTIDLSSSLAGTYTITNTIAASGGCPATSATATIVINAPQSAAFSYTASPYCQSGINPSPTFSGGGVAGTFSSTTGLSITAASGLINLASSTAGTYTVTNTIAASGGCPAVTASATITISPLQNAAFNYSASSFCQSATNPTPTITGVSGGTFSSSPSGLSINAGTGTISLSTSTLNTYTITYTTPGPCANSSSVTVAITTVPVATASATNSVCSGQIISLTSTGGGTYSWDGPGAYSSGVQNPTIDPAGLTNSGTYTVTVNNGGCTDTAQVNVTVVPLPVADAGSDVTIVGGNNTELNASGGTSYSWSPATGLSCTNCQDPVASPTVTTTYCVVVNNGGCSDNDCVTITVDVPCITNKDLGVPNAFSPNNDGNNDEFCLSGWSACMDAFNIIIFDRWGEKVFESSEADFCWDGTFRGKTLDPAVFVYFITAKYTVGDNVTKKGNISIIR